MVIFCTDCNEDLRVLVIALLLRNGDFLNVSLLATTSRLSLKSNALCVCLYPPLFCNIVGTLILVSGLTQKCQKCHIVCQVIGPVILFSHVRALALVTACYMKVMGTMNMSR